MIAVQSPIQIPEMELLTLYRATVYVLWLMYLCMRQYVLSADLRL